MLPELVFRARGVLDGVTYVSDGAILIRADLVQGAANPAGVSEIPSINIRGMFATLGTQRVTLDQLVRSQMADAFRMPSEVALAAKYVAMLREMRDVALVPHTVTSPVVIFSGPTAIGVLMPMNLPPELGTMLPPPAAHAQRGRVVSFAGAVAVVRLSEGREVHVDVSSMAPALANLAVPHALVDVDVSGRPFAWIAGTRDPRPAPAPAPPPARTFDAKTTLSHIAASIAARGARISQVGSLDYPAYGETPPFTIHVLERVFDERREGNFFVVTNGLSREPLPGGDGGIVIARFELLTWTSAHNLALLNTIASVGTALHQMAHAGSRFSLGHSISTGAPGFMGWPRVMISRMSQLSLAHGNVDLARVTPITNEEWDEKQASFPEDVMGGYPFVTALEHRGFPQLLARWHTPPP